MKRDIDTVKGDSKAGTDKGGEGRKKKRSKKKRKREKAGNVTRNEAPIETQGQNSKDKNSVSLDMQASIYLEKFVNDKDNWKFKKKIQVWLLKNAFDPSAIKKNVFPLFLEYLKGLKGISRETTLKKAKDVLEVESIMKSNLINEDEETNEANSDAFKKQKKRARIRLKRANAIAKVLA